MIGNYIKDKLLQIFKLSFIKTTTNGQQKIVNRGRGAIFKHLCAESLICFEINCFYSLQTQTYEYVPPPPQLLIFCC